MLSFVFPNLTLFCLFFFIENYKITLMTPLKSPAAAGFLQHQKKKLVNKQHQTPLNNINTMEGQIFVSFFLFFFFVFLRYVLTPLTRNFLRHCHDNTEFVVIDVLLLLCTKHHHLQRTIDLENSHASFIVISI